MDRCADTSRRGRARTPTDARQRPVGYVEAWYVDPDVRRHGYGRALLAAAEAWAVEQGYREMASDALIDNITSHEAHKASGYIEGDRVVGFRKALPERA